MSVLLSPSFHFHRFISSIFTALIPPLKSHAPAVLSQRWSTNSFWVIRSAVPSRPDHNLVLDIISLTTSRDLLGTPNPWIPQRPPTFPLRYSNLNFISSISSPTAVCCDLISTLGFLEAITFQTNPQLTQLPHPNILLARYLPMTLLISFLVCANLSPLCHECCYLPPTLLYSPSLNLPTLTCFFLSLASVITPPTSAIPCSSFVESPNLSLVSGSKYGMVAYCSCGSCCCAALSPTGSSKEQWLMHDSVSSMCENFGHN